MPIDTVHPQYTAQADAWTTMRDVVAGHRAFQKGGERYLPKLSDQNDKEYKAYRQRAPFFNATGRVVDGLSEMVFRVDPVIEKGEAIQPFLDDMTLTGVPFSQFAEQLLEENLTLIRAGVLVDFPSVVAEPGRPITVRDAEQRGLRPYASIYKAESIINWADHGGWAGKPS